jgi:hypothetical protein
LQKGLLMTKKHRIVEFKDKAGLTPAEQIQLTVHAAAEMAKIFPDSERVSAQVGGIKITLKTKPE